MPVDAGLLSSAGQTAMSGAQALSQAYQQMNPVLGYIQGMSQRNSQLIAAYNAQIAGAQLQLAVQKQAQDTLEQNRRFGFDVTKEQADLQQKQLDQQITMRGQDLTSQAAMGNLGVAQGNLALAQQAQPLDLAQKQASIDQIKYGMNPNNPDNQVKFSQIGLNQAQAQAALFNMQKPNSSEGQLAFDIQHHPDLAPSIANIFSYKTGIPERQKDIFNQEKDLRTEFTSNTKNYQDAIGAFNSLQTAVKDPSSVGDMSVAFAYMKLLNPTMQVRPGTIALATDVGSIPNDIVAAYNRAVNGQKLDPAVRADYVKKATELYAAQKDLFDQQKQQYTDLANKNGLNPNNVVTDYKPINNSINIPQVSPQDFIARDQRLGLPPGTSQKQFQWKSAIVGAKNG